MGIMYLFLFGALWVCIFVCLCVVVLVLVLVLAFLYLLCFGGFLAGLLASASASPALLWLWLCCAFPFPRFAWVCVDCINTDLIILPVLVITAIVGKVLNLAYLGKMKEIFSLLCPEEGYLGKYSQHEPGSSFCLWQEQMLLQLS